MTARTVDILSQRAHWENRLDYRDIRTLSHFSPYGIGNGPYITLTNGTDARDIVNDPANFDQTIVRDIGFMIDVIIGVENSSNANVIIINGMSFVIFSQHNSAPYYIYYPGVPVIDIQNRTGGTRRYSFLFRYIPKEKYNLEHPMTWPTTEKPGSEKRKLPKGIADSD